jgi:hypothetical protein
MDPLGLGAVLAFTFGILVASLYMYRQLKVDERTQSAQAAEAAARPRSVAPPSARPAGWVDVTAYNGAAAGQVAAVMLEIKTAAPEDPAHSTRGRSQRLGAADYRQQQRKSTSAALARELQPRRANDERDAEGDAEPEAPAEPGAAGSRRSRRQPPRPSQRQPAGDAPQELSEPQILARALEQRGCNPHVANLLAANGITSVNHLAQLDGVGLALVIEDPQDRAMVEEVARTANLLRGSAQV